MTDHARFERQHLERNLQLAELIGDEQWAKRVRDELKKYEPKPKKKTPAKTADVKKDEVKEGDGDGRGLPAS